MDRKGKGSTMRNGSGTYVVYTPGNPVVTGTTISSTTFNNTINDIATALTGSISADGQTPITANIPMNSHKLTGLAAPTVAGDALSYGGVVAGSTGAFTSSALGTQVIATNGGTTTLTVSSPYYTVFTGTFVQNLVLPDATTLTVGQQYGIDNDGSLAITVKTNGGATLWTIASGCDLYLTLTAQATAVGTWETDYQGAQLATGKTLVVNNSVTVNGTDGTTMTLPTTSATIARTDASQTFTGAQSFSGGVDKLTTATGVVSVSAATAPSVGQVLKATSATVATWQTLTATGDVVGPASATDNAVARFDATTGKLIQNSAVTIDDSGILTAVGIAKSSLPTGSVLQVVNATTTTNTVTTSNTYQATSLTASITPTSATSKVLVSFTATQGCNANDDMYVTIYRNGANILPAGGVSHLWLNSSTIIQVPGGHTHLDSPASTSAQTYTIYIKNGANVVTIQFGAGFTQSITLMEIAA